MAKESTVESSHLVVTIINNKPYLLFRRTSPTVVEKSMGRKCSEFTVEEDVCFGDPAEMESYEEGTSEMVLLPVDQLTLSLFFRVAFSIIPYSLHYEIPIQCFRN